MIEFIKYIIIGLIQGITEVLPVSSSGHLTIVEHMMGINNDNLAFEVFLHLASFIAVIAFLYKPLIKIIKGSFLYLFKKKKEYFLEWKYLICVIISTIPIVLFTIFIKRLGYNTSPLFVIGISLIFNAAMLFLLSKIKGERKKEEITMKDALVIGLFQCLGVFPGISRSGSCISGAMVRKIEKEEAANYAFMLFVPAVIGAFVLELDNISLIFTLNSKMISCYLASFLVSMVATFYAFKILLNFIKKGKLFYFSIYCLVIGIVTFVYSSMNGWI